MIRRVGLSIYTFQCPYSLARGKTRAMPVGLSRHEGQLSGKAVQSLAARCSRMQSLEPRASMYFISVSDLNEHWSVGMGPQKCNIRGLSILRWLQVSLGLAAAWCSLCHWSQDWSHVLSCRGRARLVRPDRTNYNDRYNVLPCLLVGL